MRFAGEIILPWRCEANPMFQTPTDQVGFGVQSGAIAFAWVTYESSASYQRLGSRLLRTRHALQHLRPERWSGLWRADVHCLQQKCNLRTGTDSRLERIRRWRPRTQYFGIAEAPQGRQAKNRWRCRS